MELLQLTAVSVPRTKPYSDKLKSIHQDAIDNIRFAKGQQFRIVNYAALIYAALYFIARDGTDLSNGALSIIALATWAASVGLLFDLQFKGIGKARERISRIYTDCFTDTERLELRLKQRHAWDDPWVFLALIAALTVGLGIVLSKTLS